MVDGWAYSGAPQVGVGAGQVTLVEGVTFCVCEANGDIEAGHEQGLFYRDTRFLSGWRLEVDGCRLSVLGHRLDHPYAGTFVTRRPPAPHLADSTVVVSRRRFVGNGMVETITVHNFGRETAAVDMRLVVDSDFAGLFEVKEGRARPRAGVRCDAGDGALTLEFAAEGHARAVRVVADNDARTIGSEMRWQLLIGPHEERTVTVSVTLFVDGVEAAPRFAAGVAAETSRPAIEAAAWRKATPVVVSGHDWYPTVVARSVESLGALRIFHPTDPERTVVAAGAPWFMTLFGRDALLTSWMMLPVDPLLALGTVRTLAELQGRRVDPLSEEEPGKILHELRSGPEGQFVLGDGTIYYGSVDATPLFVMLLGELYRWGIDPARLDDLLPHAWLALEWLERYGDADGDAFIEYRRTTDRGLVNQGWKDSFDAINDCAGALAEPPIALAEVQGYAYAAYLAGAQLAERQRDLPRGHRYRSRAKRLKQRFNEMFWLPARGHYACALDGRKQPVDALVSNLGHCLWTGIVDRRKAAPVAAHLVGPQMFTGFGVRTLAAGMGRYNPVSYHNGSVWPHDTAIVAAGLMRYGFVAEAHRLIMGLVDAATCVGGVLPELFCGFDRDRFPAPVPYPTSCFPQAWAAAAPVLLLRTMLRLDPDLPAGVVSCAPAVPAELLPLHVHGIRLGDAVLSVDVDHDSCAVTGIPDGIRLRSDPPRPWLLRSSAEQLQPTG